MAGDRRAQTRIARGTFVNARRQIARAQRTSYDPTPGSVWKQRGVRKSRSEVVACRAEKERRYRYRLPDVTHPDCAGRRSPRFRCRTFCLELTADKCPGARTRCCESFSNKGFISDCDRRSRDRQRGGQFPRGGQPLSRSKAPVQNRLPDLTVYLAAKVISVDKTDMKSHSPEPALVLDWTGNLAQRLMFHPAADGLVNRIAGAGVERGDKPELDWSRIQELALLPGP